MYLFGVPYINFVVNFPVLFIVVILDTTILSYHYVFLIFLYWMHLTICCLHEEISFKKMQEPIANNELLKTNDGHNAWCNIILRFVQI